MSMHMAATILAKFNTACEHLQLTLPSGCHGYTLYSQDLSSIIIEYYYYYGVCTA